MNVNTNEGKVLMGALVEMRGFAPHEAIEAVGDDRPVCREALKDLKAEVASMQADADEGALCGADERRLERLEGVLNLADAE